MDTEGTNQQVTEPAVTSEAIAIPGSTSSNISSIVIDELTPNLSTSSPIPKIPIYNNLVVSNDQRSSPSSSANPSHKKVISRSGTPSTSGTSLQLKLVTSKASAGDVYEFHSSPEDSSSPNQCANFFYSAGSATSSNILQPKSASVSSIQSSENQQPPQKRIKTAILAKKLLAAAADSNIIDPTGLTVPGTSRSEQWEHETHSLSEDYPKEDEEAEADELIEDEEAIEEQEADETEQDECLQIQRGRAHSSTSVLVQEQKKVPPLRISLLKTPSEEGAEVQTSPSFRRNRGGRVGGRRQGHGSKKDDLQRVTRSRVRQITTEEGTDGTPNSGRKRRYRATENVGLLEEEDTMSSTAEGPEENAGGGNPGDDEKSEEQRSEDSQHSTLTRAVEATANAAVEKSQKPSVAASILSKNSLEQSAAFEALLREKWAQQYREHLELVADMVESASLDSCQETIHENTSITNEDFTQKDWPESLQKLYAEQAKRSQEMTEAHRLDRERIQKMAKREYSRAAEAQHRAKTGREGEKQHSFMTVVTLLRDSECYDPGFFIEESTSSAQNIHNSPLSQMQQRFTYLANTTKNRHTMEAHVLAENHKTEWNRTLRKIARENERKQILKGSDKKQLQIPTECCNESIVPIVKVFDISLNTFQIDETHKSVG